MAFSYSPTAIAAAEVTTKFENYVKTEVKKIKWVVMATAGILIVLTLIGASIFPLWAQIHYSRHHNQFDFNDTVPPIYQNRGVESLRPTIRGVGWVNPSYHYPNYVYSPAYIIDYNKCLSRALYSVTDEVSPDYHYRVSLCGATTNDAVDKKERYVIDIREFKSDDQNNVFMTAKGVTLNYDEFLSLVKMNGWVENWVVGELKQQEINNRNVFTNRHNDSSYRRREHTKALNNSYKNQFRQSTFTPLFTPEPPRALPVTDDVSQVFTNEGGWSHPYQAKPVGSTVY
jgi:hypothetical protein